MLSHSKEIIELEGANETPVISILKEKKSLFSGQPQKFHP